MSETNVEFEKMNFGRNLELFEIQLRKLMDDFSEATNSKIDHIGIYDNSDDTFKYYPIIKITVTKKQL
jgi:hypothetical protein